MAETSAGFVERALGYAALSYGFGFVVVMLHTARLGFPVIALLEPIYVWIGLPLTVVAFFGNQLAAQLRKHTLKARDELVSAVGSIRPVDGTTLEMAMRELSQAIASTFTFFPYHLGEYIYRSLFTFIFRNAAKDKAKTEGLERVAIYARRIVIGISGVRRLLQMVYLVALFIVALWAYVWHIYPGIPKSYGGGAPMSVRFVLSKNALPVPILADLGVDFRDPGLDSAEGVPTVILPLLYSTADAFYVRTLSAQIVSITSGTVQAIIWPRKMPLGDSTKQ